MKSFIPFTLAALILCLLASSSSAAFTNIYVFGDTLSATTNIAGKPTAPGGSDYYQQRYSNGRVWVEVLAQRQGVTLKHTNNHSYYDHNSSTLLSEISSFSAASTSTSLFVVWVCNSDTFDAADAGYDSSGWNTAIVQATNNHFKIITNLYSKGARTLILPNAVDISKTPDYNASPNTNTMRNGCIAYNAAYSNLITQIRLNTNYPGLKIYTPDFFSLLNKALTNAAFYGLTNPLPEGYTVAAVQWPTGTLSLSNGVNPNYVFWNPLCPSARLHAVMADEVQKLLPQAPKISNITPTNNNQFTLNVTDWPGGLNGFVEGCTNLAGANWTTNLVSFSSTNTTPLVLVPASGPQRFYRLRISYYPHLWSWP